tara:strand:- start:347 stop:547 length:201 start_codon:yes stop_codon:yes gene_type:complete
MAKPNHKPKKITCPRCKGNGYFIIKESVDKPLDKVVQCPMCKSDGEIYEFENDNITQPNDDPNRVH